MRATMISQLCHPEGVWKSSRRAEGARFTCQEQIRLSLDCTGNTPETREASDPIC